LVNGLVLLHLDRRSAPQVIDGGGVGAGMEVASVQTVQFTVSGRRFELSRRLVEDRLGGVAPEPVVKHAVKINDVWYPVIQAFELALGIPRKQFITDTARRHFAALGFEMRGERKPHPPRHLPRRGGGTGAEPGRVDGHGTGEWFGKANVESVVVAALGAAGWRILSVAGAVSSRRVVDVVADRAGTAIGLVVEGFPPTGDPDLSWTDGIDLATSGGRPADWYAAAVVAAMRLRGRRPSWRSVIALPDVSCYRTLHAETAGSLAAACIDVWWIRVDGSVSQR
jgi:hypothetical protein